jgi:tetratricopeptide (TPR) repeat protein
MDSPVASRPRLSVAMIVRNVADLLATTLDSVREIADEIVVLDTGSTDDTARIAYARATRLVRRSWDDDFSAARNACLAETRAEWVLWLDAGELISAEDAAELRRFVDQEARADQAYAMLVQVPRFGANIAGEQVARVRLVPRREGIRFYGRVRETMHQSLADLGMSIVGISCRIQRTDREHDPQTKLRRARRNIELADLTIKEQGPTPRMLNCIADALQVLGDNAQSVQFFRQSLLSSTPGSLDMLEAYYGLLATLDNDPRNRPEQLATCLKALEVFPLDSQLLCAMGGYLQSQGRLDLAVRAYQTAHQYGEVQPESWHLDEIREIAICCHALALQLQENSEAARCVLEAGARDCKWSLRIHKHLIDLYLKLGLKAESLNQVKELPATWRNLDAYRNAVRGACLAHDRNWATARGYLESSYQVDPREPLCLRWLTMTLVALGDHASARMIATQWRSVEPMNLELRGFMQLLNLDEHLSVERDAIPASDAKALPQVESTNVRLDPAASEASPISASERSPPLRDRIRARSSTNQRDSNRSTD